MIGRAAALGLAGIALALIAALAYRHFHDMAVMEGQRALWAYEATALRQAANSRQSQPQLVVIGDSMAAGLQLSGAANYGIPGDTVEGLTLRLPGYDLGATKTVVVAVGVNNWIGDRYASFGQKYQVLLGKIPRSATIVATAIAPVSDRADRYFPVATFRQATPGANKAIQTACAARPRCRFLDLGPALAGPGGALRPEYTTDGLHLTPAGYAAWRKVLGTIDQ